MKQDAPNQDGQDASHQSADDWVQEYGNLCNKLVALRKEAINGRASSGVEQIWLEDEEQYEGIDNVNRAERMLKATSPDGTIRLQQESQEAQTRSTVFVEITRPYVDAAAARVADMLLPTDDRNYLMEPTPLPDLVRNMLAGTQVKDAAGNPVWQQDIGPDGNPVMQPKLGSNGEPIVGEDGNPLMDPAVRPHTVADEAKRVLAEAKASCEKAQTQIDDWLTECAYLDECRQVIDDSARIGTGILKGPFPKKFKRRAVVKSMQGAGIIINELHQPISRRIDCWNFYPDPACGEDIQRGAYTFERDDITGRQLSDLKGVEGYIDAAIDAVLAEGPISRVTGTSKRGDNPRSDADLYEIWYFHGYLSARELDIMGTEYATKGEGEDDGEAEPMDMDSAIYPVIATIVNDKIIRASLSILDTGEFPYDVMVWQRRAGHWTGTGVARQMRTEQRGVNAAVRNLMDNAGLSGGPQVIIHRAKIRPVNGRWELTPRKVWETVEDEDVSNVRDAIQFVNIQSLQSDLMAIIEFWMRRAEDVTGLPMLLQGQLGRAPDTVGGMTMLNNNAAGVLRRLARYFDARVTSRHIGRYYEFLLIYGEDDSAKGDFTIKARGSSALVERDSQSQLLTQMIGVSKDPSYGIHPKRLVANILKAQRISVEDVEYSDEEYAEAMKNAGQNPQVAITQVKEQGANQRLQATLQDNERGRQIDIAFRQWEKQVDALLAQAEMQSEEQQNDNGIKAQLAAVHQKLRTTIALAMNNQAGQVMEPPIEPPGRAPAGQSFAR